MEQGRTVFETQIINGREYRVTENVCCLRTTSGDMFLADKRDVERITTKKWYTLVNKKYKTIRCTTSSQTLGSFILCTDGLVDHIDLNPFNNLRDNLRLGTKSSNAHNTRKRPQNKTGYKGVSRYKETRFQVHIEFRGKPFYVGSFDDIIEAAEAYDKFARIFHGESGRYNFPREGEYPA